RVMAAADELGYRPNRAARALSTRRTGNLGLIVADIANPFFPPLIKAAQAQARVRDYHVFIAELGRDVPFTVVNRRVKDLPCVLMDIASGVRQAVAHLAGLGHRTLTVVTGPRASWTGQELGRAATERAVELGLGLHLIGPNPPTEDGGATAAEEVVELGGTAVLTHNDLMAIGLIRGLRHLGRQVPRDMSVIGVDNTDAGRHSDPSLTTVDMPT